ncbi:hypothetical protein Poli38472_004895 [Pythium oligandrum]|uniref:Uncharacterized protein n=1 Tax=Pythium oligandrum TaxID=41045 RepID=A0A8K1CAP2_PYTOL|nr:hypothetical protein Poli38472_004895 [Pythium oligandrum]|eukprot:TMW59826.1 hypothetical protein Poli38472_004895 [Pythium oligandrum]
MDDFDAYFGADNELETLEAALAFVDTFQLESDTSSSDALTPKPMHKSKKRDRTREEVLYLREVVHQLQGQLASLKANVTVSGPMAREIPKAVWMSFAQRQRRDRRRAEEENLRLRLMLESQLRLSKSLERLIHKPDNLELLPANARKRPRRAENTNPLDAPNAIKQLGIIVDAMHQVTDTVFSDPNYETRSSKRQTEVETDPSTGTKIRNFETRVLPFEFEHAAAVFWEMTLARMNANAGHETSQMTEEENDGVSAKIYDGTVSWNGSDNEIRVKGIGRRYMGSDRVVFVGCMLMEIPHLNDEVVDDGFLRVRVWHILQPHQTDPSSPPMTLHRSHSVITPEYCIDSDPPATQHKVGELTNFIVNVSRAQMDRADQIVENRLAETLAGMHL